MLRLTRDQRLRKKDGPQPFTKYRSSKLFRIFCIPTLLFGLFSLISLTYLKNSKEPILYHKNIDSEPKWILAGEWREKSNLTGFSIEVNNGLLTFHEILGESKADLYKIRWLSPPAFIGKWTTQSKGGGSVGGLVVHKPLSVFQYSVSDWDVIDEVGEGGQITHYHRSGHRPTDLEIAKSRAQWNVMNENKDAMKVEEQYNVEAKVPAVQNLSNDMSQKSVVIKPVWLSNLVGVYLKDGGEIGFNLSFGINSSTLYFSELGGTYDNAVVWIKEGKTFIAKWSTSTYGGVIGTNGEKFENAAMFEIASGNSIIEHTDRNTKVIFRKARSGWSAKSKKSTTLKKEDSRAATDKPSFMTKPKTSTNFKKEDSRAAAVKASFMRAWNAYWTHCKGSDDLLPLQKSCNNWVNMEATAVDSISTMAIMNLKGPLKEVREQLSSDVFKNKLTQDRMVSTFETTIRILGGLLSAYDLTKEGVYLERAKLLGNGLLKAFQPNGLPLGMVNLKTGANKPISWAGGNILLAEIMTLQLEFFKLSEYTKDQKYKTIAEKPIQYLWNIQKPLAGQLPIYITKQGVLSRKHVSWGAMGDSGYEYLLKLWILTGKKHEQLRKMFVDATTGMLDNLYTEFGDEMAYIAEWNGKKINKMDHLACFAPGSLALGVYHGAYNGIKSVEARHMGAADKLASMCWKMYDSQPSGIAPENVNFQGGSMRAGTRYYILRPETVESFFYLWRITKQQKWRDRGWAIFKALEEKCAVPGWGYVPLIDVTKPKAQDKNGVMHSFFLAETLKYLYLLFSDESVLSIDEFVFNTEAHPLRVQKENSRRMAADNGTQSIDFSQIESQGQDAVVDEQIHENDLTELPTNEKTKDYVELSNVTASVLDTVEKKVDKEQPLTETERQEKLLKEMIEFGSARSAQSMLDVKV